MDKFTIIVDSREKQNLEFQHELVESVEVSKLDTGDYSISGLEDLLCIERKGSLSEFYGNCTQARFKKELERMTEYKYRFLILEFPLSDIFAFPHSLGVPKKIWSKMKVSPNYLLKCVAVFQVKYGINVIFAENRDMATTTILNIMKEVWSSECKS